MRTRIHPLELLTYLSPIHEANTRHLQRDMNCSLCAIERAARELVEEYRVDVVYTVNPTNDTVRMGKSGQRDAYRLAEAWWKSEYANQSSALA